MASNMNKTAKVLAIVAMASAFAAIILAIIFDVISFREVILQFVASLILPILCFVVLFIAMIASIIFIFGIYLLKDYGFWPLTLSIDFFKQLLSELKVSEQAVQTFIGFRFVLIFICLCIIALAIVSKVLLRKQIEEPVEGVKKPRRKKSGARAMANVGIIFGILGLVVSLSAVALVAQI